MVEEFEQNQNQIELIWQKKFLLMYNTLLKKINSDKRRQQREENLLKKLTIRKGDNKKESKKEKLPDHAEEYINIIEPLAGYMLAVGPEKSRRIRVGGRPIEKE